MSNQKYAYLMVAVIIVLSATYIIWWQTNKSEDLLPPPEPASEIVQEEIIPNTLPIEQVEVIGRSVLGKEISAYTFGNGSTTLLFVGGIHGGYEWNSSLLAYQFIEALREKIILLPETISVVVIPTLNPDGHADVVGKDGEFTANEVPENNAHETGEGRFNANNVDLNRNFDCKWQPESSWRGQTVKAGSAPFSEPEALALRDLVLKKKPAAAIFWHSRANAVYASECENGILPRTREIMNAYATAAKYTPIDVFDAYPVTGDAEGWLASLGIPAVTVELETRTSSEWERNKSGIEAVLNLY